MPLSLLHQGRAPSPDKPSRERVPHAPVPMAPTRQHHVAPAGAPSIPWRGDAPPLPSHTTGTAGLNLPCLPSGADVTGLTTPILRIQNKKQRIQAQLAQPNMSYWA